MSFILHVEEYNFLLKVVALLLTFLRAVYVPEDLDALCTLPHYCELFQAQVQPRFNARGELQLA